MLDDRSANDDQHTTCPKCGYDSSNPDVCDACGAIFSRVRVRQARQEIMEETLGPSDSHDNAHGRVAAPSSNPLPGILGTIAVFVAVFLIVYRVLIPGSTTGASGTLPDDLLASDGERAVLVEFWAPWCGPCKILSPVIDELEREYRGKLKVVRINIDEDGDAAARFKVTAIPTVIICDREGRVLQRTVGIEKKQTLAGLIDRSIRD